jgi:hypothetical protein
VTATETKRPERQPGAWLDEGEVSPEWAPPAGNPVRRPRIPGSLIYGGVVLALVLVIAVLWGAGGFGQRTDLLRPVEPGAVFSTGPFELTFTEATAQQKLETDGVMKWEIVVIGRARNTGDVTMAPPHVGPDRIFAIKDPDSDLRAEASNADIGDDPDSLGIHSRLHLTPNLPPTGYRLIFPLPAEFRPGPTIRLAVADLVYEAKYLTNDEKAWNNDLHGSRIDLPLRVLPPKE